MSLTVKFLGAFMAASLLSLAGHACVRVRRETEHFDSHMRSYAGAYAASLAHGIEAVDASFGPDTALLIVKQANQSSPQFRARWVTLEGGGRRLEGARLPLDRLAGVRRGERLAVEVPGERGTPGSLVAYVPLAATDAAGARSAVEVVESLKYQQDFQRATIRDTLLFSFTVLALTSVIAAVLGMSLIRRPIQKLVDKAQRIGSGDLSGPIVLRQRDELGLLAGEMNAMCERLQEARARVLLETSARIHALEQMRHADRLATVGRLASGIAHEIGTPLAVAGGRIGMVASGEVVNSEAVENARIAGEQLLRISATIRQLLDFARRRPTQKGPIDLGALAARTCAWLQPLARTRGVKIETCGDPVETARALGDLGQLEQALTNLVINAIHATPSSGRIEISWARAHATPPLEIGGPEAEFLRLNVVDNGSGMDAETKSHLFEPFFTTKAVGEGSGLGLAVTYGIVREHGGWIDVASEPARGSRFTLYLPAV